MTWYNIIKILDNFTHTAKKRYFAKRKIDPRFPFSEDEWVIEIYILINLQFSRQERLRPITSQLQILIRDPTDYFACVIQC